MDDPTLARLPVVLTVVEGPGTKVTPRCSNCGIEVPDITDPKHHICILDADGKLVEKTTADVGLGNYQTAVAAAVAEADAAKP